MMNELYELGEPTNIIQLPLYYLYDVMVFSWFMFTFDIVKARTQFFR